MSIRLTYTDIDTGVFPVDYSHGRQQWLDAVARLSQRQRPYPCAGHGPDNEALFTDTAWIGNDEAENVMVLLAGTHGVEGLTGSAIQSDLLQLLACGNFVIPTNSALLLVHALTPWGYAWLRRCDADGVDLNRNAVDFSRPLPDNPDYDRLRWAMFETDSNQRRQAFADYEREYGRVALEKAISGGQYLDPAGPFYGGQAPAHGRLVCEDIIRHHSLSQRRLALIDLHTGLGSYGYGEIICDHAPDSDGAMVAKQWYGDATTLPLAGTSSSVPKLGLLDYAWHAIMDKNSCYITLEFGTYSTDCLFETLLRDHQLWAKTDNAAERMAHAKLMRRHFCPNDSAWQEMVLFRARQVIAQGLRGVSS